MRGGGAGEGGRPEEEDGSVDGGPGCMPIGRGRSGGGVRLRPVSGMRGEGGGVVAQRGRSERGTGDGTGSVRVRKTSQGLFGALHFAARSGSDIQFLVIIRLLGDEEGLSLLDCEFTTKVAR